MTHKKSVLYIVGQIVNNECQILNKNYDICLPLLINIVFFKMQDIMDKKQIHNYDIFSRFKNMLHTYISHTYDMYTRCLKTPETVKELDK